MTRTVRGLTNFRDFGGYDTAHGRKVARDRLYRSAGLAELTEDGVADLQALDLGLVVDLRHPAERAREPSRLPPGFRGLVLATEGDGGGDAAHLSGLLTGIAGTGDGRAVMVEYYRHAPFSPDRTRLFAAFFKALAEVEGAVLIHCTAGKDRTGLLVALTQHMLGVHRDDILAEYMRSIEALAALEAASSKWLIRQNVDAAAVDPAIMRAMASVHASYLEAALDAIAERHGGLDPYVSEILGLDGALRDRLHARLHA